MKRYRSLLEAARDLAPVMCGPVSVLVDSTIAAIELHGYTWGPPKELRSLGAWGHMVSFFQHYPSGALHYEVLHA